MTRRRSLDAFMHTCLIAAIPLTAALTFTAQNTLAAGGSQIVMKIAAVQDEDEDAFAAGKAVAESLKRQMGDVPLKAAIVSECFEDREYKQKLLNGICSVLPKQVVLGGATYGSFTQAGCTDFDAVALVGIGGDGIGVCAQLVTKLGTSKLTFEKDEALIRERLRPAGERLAKKFRRTDRDKLTILIADAHSPKVQYLIDGVQKVLGKQFPITGGCANKNAGQTFVYFQGEMHEDAALGIMLSGDFNVSLAGRQANEKEAVIATAKEGAAKALAGLNKKPFFVFAFNCAGRRSKLTDYKVELAAMQQAIGKDLPLFGCYCAGEIGPVDSPDAPADALCGGSGWHVMFTALGR